MKLNFEDPEMQKSNILCKCRKWLSFLDFLLMAVKQPQSGQNI